MQRARPQILLKGGRLPKIAMSIFWLQPNDYWISPDALTSMTLQVGHGPFRQRSPIPARRITRFQAIAPKGTVVELHEQLRLGQGAEDGDFRLKSPGAYVLVLQTDDRAQTHLPSIRFNDYLKAEGPTPALEQRERLHRMDTDGSERYSRCAKSSRGCVHSRRRTEDSRRRNRAAGSRGVETSLELHRRAADMRPTTAQATFTLRSLRYLFDGPPLCAPSTECCR
jgi:hypothetical protein